MIELPDNLMAIMVAWMRAAAVVIPLPVFTGRLIPVPFRLALAAFLALAVPETTTASLPVPGSGLILIGIQNVLVGLMMSMAVAVVFATIDMAGRLISN